MKDTNIDTIIEVQKFNPYHDRLGRFSSANGASSFTYKPGKSKAHDNAIAREKERTAAMGAASASSKPEVKTQKDHPEGKYGGAERIKQDLGVSDEEANKLSDAVTSFSCSGYVGIRKYQHKGPPPSGYKEQAENLEKFIEKSPKWDGGEVYRGIHVSTDVARQIISNASAGHLINQQGASSWTTDIVIARNFSSPGTGQASIIFKSKGQQNGTSIRHLSQFQNENEVLMSSKAVWKMTKVTKTGRNKWEIECDPFTGDVAAYEAEIPF